MLGFVGGVLGLVHSIAYVFMQFVANRQFYLFVISKLYADDQNSIKINIAANENNKRLDTVNTNVNTREMRSKKVLPINELSTPSTSAKKLSGYIKFKNKLNNSLIT